MYDKNTKITLYRNENYIIENNSQKMTIIVEGSVQIIVRYKNIVKIRTIDLTVIKTSFFDTVDRNNVLFVFDRIIVFYTL